MSKKVRVVIKDSPTRVLAKKEGQAISVSWSKVKGAKGYAVYRAAGDGTYVKVKVIKGGKMLKWIDQQTMAGKTYSYKIKACKKTGRKTVYGTFSKPAKLIF